MRLRHLFIIIRDKPIVYILMPTFHKFQLIDVTSKRQENAPKIERLSNGTNSKLAVKNFIRFLFVEYHETYQPVI